MIMIDRNIIGLVVLFSLLATTPRHGQWVEPPGTGWINLQVAHQTTERAFDKNGNIVSLGEVVEGARSTITTVRVSGALGLVRGIDVWGDLPFHRQEFNSPGSDLLTTGAGDARVFLRAGPSLIGVDALPVAVALRGGVKLTTGNFVNDAETISLSQGQRDWSLLLELGKSLHPLPLYVSGWTGYRWREENEEIARDFGNEWVFNTAVGGHLDRFEWKLSVDGFFGDPTFDTRTGFEFAARELVQVIPTAGWNIGPGTAQIGARIPVHGQSPRFDRLPAGPTFTVGYFLSWDNPLWK